MVLPMIGHAAPPTTESTDAAVTYALAGEAITTDSPAASNMTYPGYPPFGDDWDYLAKQSWEENAPARAMARQARTIGDAHWPPAHSDFKYLNRLRNLANIVGDAALYADLNLGQHAEGVECVQDLIHLSELLRDQPDQPGAMVRLLVSIGIRAIAMDRLLTITSAIELTDDPSDTTAVQTATARRLIHELLSQRDGRAQIGDIIAIEVPGRRPGDIPKDPTWTRAIETVNRVNSERTFAAMSLACHLFQFKNGRWPAALEELVPDYLPSVPVDPWGNGQETFGYVLIKGGLPDGSDRPLVYCRCFAPDGLFYRTDIPLYDFYFGDGSNLPSSQQKRGGQFRDVARWTPPAEKPAGPTTQPLPNTQ
jgi:hypothetical protein